MQFKLIRPRKLCIGLLLILVGLILPVFISIDTFQIHDILLQGLNAENQAMILEAAFLLAFHNAVLGCPYYIGTFFVARSFETWQDGIRLRWFDSFVAICSILLIYQLLFLIHGIQLTAGVPTLGIITLLWFLWTPDYSYVPAIKKAPMMVLIITGFQFLDVLPALAQMPFGRSETSQDIILVAQLMQMDAFLDSAMTVMFLFCVCTGLLLFSMLRDQNRLLEISVLKEEKEAILVETRIRELEARSTRELQHLVHDLKTPLTSIQTLAFVVKLRCTGEEHQETRTHLEHIEHSVDHMSTMISELLHENHRVPTPTQLLLHIVLAQLSASPYADFITFDNRIPDATISINGIRMARAIINLTDNAWQAKQADIPFQLRITVDEHSENGQPFARINIADNGIGIPPQETSKIWDRGISSKGSTGLGMTFVHETVTQSDGHIKLFSTVGVGTSITLFLPIGDDTHV